jgi:ABC-type phosphate/phosphonate transport system substrate-binding protein
MGKQSMIATLPMYDWPELADANRALWECLYDAFCEVGFSPPKSLSQAEEGKGHWLRPDLMFSQTCGYPLAVDLLNKVDVLATPIYDVEGCGDGTYRSALVVPKNATFRSAEDTKGSRFAFNGANSLSGFRCMFPKVGDPRAWFSQSVESGSHRVSAQRVADGGADVAAIDAVCWAYIQQYDPKVAEQLRVLDWTDVVPALPFISAKSKTDEEVNLKRSAINAGVDQALLRYETKPLFLTGVTEKPLQDYIKLRLLSSG